MVGNVSLQVVFYMFFVECNFFVHWRCLLAETLNKDLPAAAAISWFPPPACSLEYEAQGTSQVNRHQPPIPLDHCCFTLFNPIHPCHVYNIQSHKACKRCTSIHGLLYMRTRCNRNLTTSIFVLRPNIHG